MYVHLQNCQRTQSIQIAKLSVPSSELGPPPPPTSECCSPLGSTGGDTLACEGGGGGTQFRRRDRHSGTLCILYNNPSTLRVSRKYAVFTFAQICAAVFMYKMHKILSCLELVKYPVLEFLNNLWGLGTEKE
jgi:hypothetical protein